MTIDPCAEGGVLALRLVIPLHPGMTCPGDPLWVQVVAWLSPLVLMSIPVLLATRYIGWRCSLLAYSGVVFAVTAAEWIPFVYMIVAVGAFIAVFLPWGWHESAEDAAEKAAL